VIPFADRYDTTQRWVHLVFQRDCLSATLGDRSPVLRHDVSARDARFGSQHDDVDGEIRLDRRVILAADSYQTEASHISNAAPSWDGWHDARTVRIDRR
jgi:hypothetical protein